MQIKHYTTGYKPGTKCLDARGYHLDHWMNNSYSNMRSRLWPTSNCS